MKKRWTVLLAVIIGTVWTGTSFAESGGQVFYRIGSAHLAKDRGDEVFTDTLDGLGSDGTNNGTSGLDIGAGLDIPLTKILDNTLLGEVFLDYAKFSDKQVVQTTSALTSPSPGTSHVVVSELAVVVAPKYRFEFGKLRLWIIPIGLAFLVNSPPSNDTTYLDYGAHFGAGVEYRLVDLISLGVDYRLTIGSGQSHTQNDYGSVGGYVGINF